MYGTRNVKITNSFGETAATIFMVEDAFYPENGGSRFLRNDGNYLPKHAALYRDS
jgi:hypothetical protein